MVKQNIKLISLVFLLAICAPTMVIGMQEETSLPADVKKIIASNTLKLILNEAEGYPWMLTSPQLRYKSFWETPSIFNIFDQNAPVIDMVILLIQNGADPNMKSDEGNTVLHLLIEKNLPLIKLHHYDDEIQRDYDSFGFILQKIELLAKYNANLNAKNANGDTVADLLMEQFPYKLWLEKRYYHRILDYFFRSLKDLGVDFTTIKDKKQEGILPWNR